MGRPKKQSGKLPKAEGRLTPKSNPTWNKLNLNKAALIWINELELHETTYHKCKVTEDEAIDTAFNFDESAGYPKTDSKMYALANAVRDYLKEAFSVHLERFMESGGELKMCKPDPNMMDMKAIYFMKKAGHRYSAALGMDERHPGIMTVNPAQELANTVSGIMDKRQLPVEARKQVAAIFAKSYANQQKLNGMSNKEIRKELSAGVIGVLNEIPQIKEIDEKRPDEYTKACEEAAK